MTTRSSVLAAVRALGTDFTPAQIMGSRDIYAPLVASPPESAVVGRDLQYGPEPRQRLDLFVAGPARATVVFVHGGGFVQGDKGDADAPFYNNVAAWALSQGYAAANLTYRLAPAHTWPSGPQDLAAAVDWLTDELPRHDCDPAGIVLVGQSAGGAHVAAWLAHQGLEGRERQKVRGVAMISGVYDIASAPHSGMHVAYFGEDASQWPARSTLPAIAETEIPCLLTVSELDPEMFQKQALAAVAARVERTGRWPDFHWLRGHNHITSVFQLGSPVDDLGPKLRAFIDAAGGV